MTQANLLAATEPSLWSPILCRMCFNWCAPLPTSTQPHIPHSHMHPQCRTCTSPSTHISLSSVLIHRLILTLTNSLFFSQGDDGEIGPRGLPGEPVSDHMY